MKMDKTELNYPIGMESTKIWDVFRSLGLVSKDELKKAVARGNVFVDGAPVNSISDKVRGGQVLAYGEFVISVATDENAKRERLLTEMMKTGGFRGNVANTNGIQGFGAKR